MKHRFIIFLSLILILSGCRTGDVEEAVSTVTTVSAETQATFPESNYPMALEVISPQNIDRLEQIDRWGEGNIHSVAVSPGEKTIAVYTVSGIHLYDSMTLEETQFIDTGISNISPDRGSLPIIFSPDGNILVYGNGQNVIFWDLTANQFKQTIYSPIPDWYVNGIEFNPNGDRVLIVTQGAGYELCGSEGMNYALYTIEGNLLFDRYTCGTLNYHNYRFTSDNNLYIFFNYSLHFKHPVSIFKVDTETGNVLESEHYESTADYETYDPKDSFYDVSPDGAYIASLKIENEQVFTLIKEAENGKIVRTVEGSIHFIHSDNEGPNWEEGYPYNQPKNYVNKKCGIMNGANWGGYSEVLSYGSKVMLTFGHLKTNSVRYLELWDVSRCEIEKEISFPSARAMKFSPNGQYLVTRNIYSFYVWNIKSREIGFSIYDKGGPDWWEKRFFFNRNGDKLIFQGFDVDSNTNKIFVWNILSGKFVRTLDPLESYHFELFPSTMKNLIAVKEWNKRGYQIWDIEAGEYLYTVPIEKPAFEANGNFWGIIREEDQLDKLVLYDIQTGIPLQTINTSYRWISDIIPSEDGSYLVSTHNNPDERREYLLIYDIRNGNQEKEVYIEKGIVIYSFRIQGNRFITSSHNGYGYIDFWKFGGEEPFLTIQGYHHIKTVNDDVQNDNNVISYPISFSPDERVMITSNYHYSVRFWDTETGQLLGEITPDYEIEDIAFSPDGRIIAVSGEDGLIRIWGVPEE
ncbi:MAG: WD40 repeat domain-containing protein [Anaerolineales bacterium]